MDPLIIDLDATLVTSHSDKERAVGTYKGGYGFAPFIASIDYGAGNGTGEILAALMRPGNAGANFADDHIKVFTAAIAQLPDGFYDEHGQLMGEKILVRTDSAGASRRFLHYLAGLGVQFTVSYPVPVMKARTAGWINDKQYWQPALDHAGDERQNVWVVNATDALGLTDYPEGTNLYLRAEPLHPGAQATLLDTDGHRVTAFLTNSPRWHGPTLDARHRARGRCENRIKPLKSTGLGKLPFFDFDANQDWANIAALAMNLVSRLQLTALPAGTGCSFPAGPGNWHDHHDPSQHRRTQTPPKKGSIAGVRHPRPAPATPCTTPTETWKPTPTQRQQGQQGQGPTITPKTRQPARQGIKPPPDWQPDHHEKSGLAT